MVANSSSSPFSDLYPCANSTFGSLISFSFAITHIILLLPPSFLILYLGYQQWRQQRSFATTSHSDIFTYHSAAMDLIFAFGMFLYLCGQHTGLSVLSTVGLYAISVFIPGQMSFHVLTCTERYLAVVHPIIYLRMRQSGGVRIRNMSIGCAWLLYCGWIGVTALYFPNVPYIPYFCSLVLSLVVISFCSLSVLCVLIRPGPGEMGGNRERSNDQSKQRAFHTITAITCALWLYFLGKLVCIALGNSNLLSYTDRCLAFLSADWFTLPSNLVLPLLFLHRAGKLQCCHCSNKSAHLI